MRGELYVNPTSDQPERFLELKGLYVSSRDGWEEYAVESSSLISGRPVLKFGGIDTPEEAARFTNRDVALPKEQLIELPADTYFVFELVGCMVYDSDTGECVGDIQDVMEYPSHDVYLVAMRDGRELLCPAVKQFVKSVDIAQRKVVIVTSGLSLQD